MRQEVEDIYWNCLTDVDNNYQLRSLSMDSSLRINPLKLSHHSSSESSICSEQSVSSAVSTDLVGHQDQLIESESDYVVVKSEVEITLKDCQIISNNFDEPTDTIKSKLCDFDSLTATADETLTSGNKVDDIIEKMVELKFSSDNINDMHKKPFINNNINCNDNYNNNSNIKSDGNNNNVDIKYEKLSRDENLNENYSKQSDVKNKPEENEENDNDLRARGPVRPPLFNQSRGKPYCTFNNCGGNAPEMQQTYPSDIESTAQQIMSISDYSDLLIPCLDKLEENYLPVSASDSEWILNNYDGNTDNNLNEKVQPIPEITINENLLSEESLIETLNLRGFQSAQSDVSSYTNPSPVSNYTNPSPISNYTNPSPVSSYTNPSPIFNENWPDSPTSSNSYNVMSSRSHSRASSRAQSPGSSANIGSPLIPNQFIRGSTPDFSSTSNNYRVPTAFSSPSSSNHSFGDTSSPSNYQYAIDSRIEDKLESQLSNFHPWYSKCESSSTIVNSTDSADDINNFGIFENEIQVVLNVVPTINTKAQMLEHGGFNNHKFNENKTNLSTSNNEGVNLVNTASLITSAQNDLNSDENKPYAVQYNNVTSNLYQQNLMNTEENEMNFEAELERHLLSNYPDDNRHDDRFFSSESAQTSNFEPLNNYKSNYNNFTSNYNNTQVQSAENKSSTSVNEQYLNNSWNSQRKLPFDNFQIPETVSSFKNNHLRRSNTVRNIAPWPSLNLPLTQASKRLKDQLDPKDVERAMKNLLKKSTQELAMPDQDGDTMLMCLVGNPNELEKKKAYLIPLVERLGTLDDALSKKNNREEDALYLAAVNSPRMPEVTGYLAAVMIKKGIDISQQLYRRRGDTLIHAVVANGDTHLSTLAELLSLKTSQGNYVFDLSKCNYAGRTPLHVAAEVHDPQGSGINSVDVVRLLLANGADPKIKESKCGNTALHLAVSLSCDPELVKVLLIKNGRDAVNIQNRNNNTALHMAAAVPDSIQLNKQMGVCDNLIKAGGSTNILNQHGCTPLALVSAERKKTIREIFSRKN